MRNAIAGAGADFRCAGGCGVNDLAYVIAKRNVSQTATQMGWREAMASA